MTPLSLETSESMRSLGFFGPVHLQGAANEKLADFVRYCPEEGPVPPPFSEQRHEFSLLFLAAGPPFCSRIQRSLFCLAGKNVRTRQEPSSKNVGGYDI